MSYLALLNPAAVNRSFGVIPALTLSGERLPEAEIRLFQGKHIGPHRGFGARHIWREHGGAIISAGHADETGVPHFVAQIIRTGTPLYYEGASWKTMRLMAVRAATGQAILEFRAQREGAIWSVVTAFPGTKTHGTRVGTVR
jgi:hypothetical protein